MPAEEELSIYTALGCGSEQAKGLLTAQLIPNSQIFWDWLKFSVFHTEEFPNPGNQNSAMVN